MRRIAAIVIAPALALATWAGSPASASPVLAGSLVDSPLFLYAEVHSLTQDHVFSFIAYRNGPFDDFDGVRLVAVRYARGLHGVPAFVPEPHGSDDTVLPSDAITISSGQAGSQILHLRGQLPNTGEWALDILSPPGGTRTAACPGIAVAATSGPLPHFFVSGSIGGERIDLKRCLTWGTGASGVFALRA